MSEIQDKLKVVSETAIIAGEESGLAVKDFFTSMAKWQKRVFIVGLILIIPAYFAAYYSSHYIVKSQYKDKFLEAHAAYSQTKPISATTVTVLKVAQNQYTAYFQVTNNNLDLVAPEVPYSVDFYNASGEKIYTSQGNFFLLADQKKSVVIPRIDTKEEVSTGKLSITDVKWQKRLETPKVSFKTPKPEIYDQTIIDPPQLVVEGSVINDTEYTIKKIKIYFFLYNQSNQIVGVNVRDEGNILAFGRRAYKQTWPILNTETVSRVEVSVDVNTLDPANLIFSSKPIPASENPDLK